MRWDASEVVRLVSRLVVLASTPGAFFSVEMPLGRLQLVAALLIGVLPAAALGPRGWPGLRHVSAVRAALFAFFGGWLVLLVDLLGIFAASDLTAAEKKALFIGGGVVYGLIALVAAFTSRPRRAMVAWICAAIAAPVPLAIVIFAGG
jgi:hypothetical protein